LLSAIFFVTASSVSYAQIPNSSGNESNIFLDKSFLQNVAVAFLSAVLAFLSGYALAGIGKKARSGKKLAYSINIESGLVNVEKNIKDKVKVIYETEEIVNLSNVKFELLNSGDSVIKSQEIRFEFPETTRILDFYFDPQPQPEMKVEKIYDSGIKEFEKKCRIGHIEKDQQLGIHFIVTGESEITLIPHPFNENGDVEFISRSTAKALSEKEQISRFLSLLIMYFLIPPIFSAFFSLGELMAGVARLTILLSLFRFIVPFSEVIADIVSSWLKKKIIKLAKAYHLIVFLHKEIYV
jgi:preprotein translocase subunit SecF